MHIQQLLYLQPQTRIGPELRRARLVGRLLVDPILEDADVRDGLVEEAVPRGDHGLEDVAEDGLGAVQCELLVVIISIRLFLRLEGEVER